MSTSATVWVGAILSLAAYTFLVLQDNPAFNLTEHLVVGSAAGYAIVIAVGNLKSLAFQPLLKGQMALLAPVVIGLLLYTKYFPPVAWLNRIPVALLVGLASGVALRGALESQVLGQLRATIIPPNSLSNIVLIVGVVSILWYFFLTFQRGGRLGAGVAQIGRWVMMGAFGAGFAAAVMGRFSILIGHFQFLLYTWLGLGQ